MNDMDGTIYAEGTGPNQRKDGGGKNDNSQPPYFNSPHSGYGYHGCGPSYTIGRMLAPAPPCNSRDGGVSFDRGEMRVQWMNTRANMPVGTFLGTDPSVQDNLMGWGNNFSHRYSAPTPKDDKECKGYRCSHDPDAIKNLKEVADEKGNKQWMCFMCCAHNLGYGKATEIFH